MEQGTEIILEQKRIVPPQNHEEDIGQDMKAEEPKAPEPKQQEEPTQEPNAANEGVELLRRQLAEKQREAEEQRRLRAQAEALAQQKSQELQQVHVQAQDSQLTAFVNAIASFERDGEMMERDYASLLENGNYAQAAKIQRQMAQNEAKLAQLHNGKSALEEKLQYEQYYQQQQRQQPQQQQPQYQQTQQDPIETKLSTLSPMSASWVRSHIEVLKDPQKNAAMTSAHYSAMSKGIAVDTPEYFAHLDANMGYNQQRPTSNTRTPTTAAPVSRSSVNFRSNGSVSVMLTPQQQQMAADLGMTDEEYAEGLAYYVNKGEIRI